MLKIDVTDKTYDAKPHDFGGANLNIRPFPASMGSSSFGPDGTLRINGTEQFRVFDYCLESWGDDICDLNGKPLKCTTQTKKAIYDHKIGTTIDGVYVAMSAFVFDTIKLFEQEQAEQLGN